MAFDIKARALALHAVDKNIQQDMVDIDFQNQIDVISDDSTHVHTQGTAAATWEVAHSLNKYPSVTVVDSANTVVVGDIEYITSSSLKVHFTGAFSGKAYLN